MCFCLYVLPILFGFACCLIRMLAIMRNKAVGTVNSNIKTICVLNVKKLEKVSFLC